MRQTLPPEPPAYPGERNRSPSPDPARRPSAVARSSTTRTSPGVSAASRRTPRESDSHRLGGLLSSTAPSMRRSFLPLAHATRPHLQSLPPPRLPAYGATRTATT